MMATVNEKANEIHKLLIDSGLSVSKQLQVIKIVRERLDFIKEAVNSMNQPTLDL